MRTFRVAATAVALFVSLSAGALAQTTLRIGLAEDPEITLDIAGTVHPFGIARGALTETRRWLDRGLAATPSAPTTQRIKALYGATMVTGLQGHLPAATVWVALTRFSEPLPAYRAAIGQ